MGLLADFLVATPEDALQYASLIREGKPVPPNRFERAMYKNFTPLAMGMLWATLQNVKWEVRRHRLEHVYHTEGGQSWLQRFPVDFVRLISALDEKAVTRTADAWATAEEVPGNSDELQPVLLDLKRLAIEAQKSGRDLYLWGSL